MPEKDKALKELQTIPGVGKKLAQSFWQIGITKVKDFSKRSPEGLYNKLCAYYGFELDRCVLYICRSAVYFASSQQPDLMKSKWWYWKDKKV